MMGNSINRYFVYLLSFCIVWAVGCHKSHDDSGVINSAGSDLNGIAWSGTQFATVGDGGTILTSPDGVKWDLRSAGTTTNLNGIAWSGTQFVAVGADGMILTSPTGSTWTTQTSGTTNSLNGIIWAGTQFVASGAGGTILTSPDGVTWTSQTTSTSAPLHGIAWSGALLAVAAETVPLTPFGSNAYRLILTSPDGVTWTLNLLPSDAAHLFDIAWSGAQFVAVGGIIINSEFGSVFYQSDIFTSSDGVTWVNHLPEEAVLLYGVAWSGTRFVAVGDFQTILTSFDGVTWTHQLQSITNRLNDITWSGSQFVAVGILGTILTSPDGLTWTPQNSGTT
jgi:hypothetical protein